MLDLIESYEQTRCQLQQRIHELNNTLRTKSLKTIEREKLTARRDMLSRERNEMTEDILNMKQHLGKEERLHVSVKTSFCFRS